MVAALIGLALGATVVAGMALSAGNSTDPEQQAAIAQAIQLAHARGEQNPKVVSVSKGDAETFRNAGEEIAPGRTGQFYVVTITGTFDAGMAPPGTPLARGALHRMIVYVQGGLVVGERAYP